MSNPGTKTSLRRETNYTKMPVPSAVIGDVHGCWNTLRTMLDILDELFGENQFLVSVGDLHDKGGAPHWGPLGPSESGSVKVLRWALTMHEQGKLVVVDSNHGRALAKKIFNTSSNSKPELTRTFRELSMQTDSAQLMPKVAEFLAQAPSFGIFNNKKTEKLAVAHAALSQRIFTKKVLTPQEERFCIHTRDFKWLGEETAVIGHVRVPKPTRTPSVMPSGVKGGDLLKIDTGCGEENGYLTAYIPLADDFLTVPMDERDFTKSYKKVPVSIDK